ncbi:MAG: rRNA maturation RNase YbeY [Firmicutes bacterium]|nr:rRNA maturation RNase YbeY [Bacillota bacterium]
MNSVEIFNETETKLEELDSLNGLIDYAIKAENVSNVVFNVIIVDKEKIQEINKNYRGIDRVTDVISFALEDNEDIVYEDFRLLGDIYICVDKVFSQAEEYGHSVLRELSFLTIHGFLHLLGYDHMTDTDEKVMFKRQEEILNGYGITR